MNNICMLDVIKKTFVVFAMFLTFSCIDRSDVTCKINFLPYDTDDDKTGYLDASGNFNTLQTDDEASLVVNGFGVIDETLYKFGDVISDSTAIMRDIVTFGIMSDGLMPVCKDNEYISVIDIQGKIVSQLKEFDGKEVIGCSYYSDSKFLVLLEDEYYVFVDKNGNQLFDTKYSWATDFKNGRAVVQTENQNSDLYSLVDGNGSPVFTFESEDEEDIVISHDLELLSATENDKFVIYDFSGKRIFECPSKIDEIYAFCQEGFIFCNEDEEYGLMSYEGKQLIRPRYEQLVPHGRNFLALTDDDEIRLVDLDDNILKSFDGEEIIDFKKCGFDFPNMVEQNNDKFMIIDEGGDVIADDIEFDIDQIEIGLMKFARSDHFPKQQVLDKIISICNNGNGTVDEYGAFFNRSGEHCLPSNINFLTSLSTQSLVGMSRARTLVSKGINYELNYDVVFDENIIKAGESGLNENAWLQRVELYVSIRDVFEEVAFRNTCVHKLADQGYEVFYQKGGNHIFRGKDNKLIVVASIKDSPKYEFCVLIMPDTEQNYNNWKAYVDSL